MSKTIKIYDINTDEYKRLVAAAAMLTAYDEQGGIWSVQNTYFDFGQNWVWTTLIHERSDGARVQIYPTHQERIVMADTPAVIAEIAEEMRTAYK